MINLKFHIKCTARYHCWLWDILFSTKNNWNWTNKRLFNICFTTAHIFQRVNFPSYNLYIFFFSNNSAINNFKATVVWNFNQKSCCQNFKLKEFKNLLYFHRERTYWHFHIYIVHMETKCKMINVRIWFERLKRYLNGFQICILLFAYYALLFRYENEWHLRYNCYITFILFPFDNFIYVINTLWWITSI